jgi:hypothetical protein
VSDRADRTLAAAEHVARVLAAHNVASALIGGMALAVHGYPRFTVDVDLATDTDPLQVLPAVAHDLSAQGYGVRFAAPDAGDPLGGVMTVTGPDFDPVQIVNYYNPYRPNTRLALEAIRGATPAGPDVALRVVGLPHLVALKLYAGGPKSHADVVELLRHNPDADLEGVRAVCRRFHLDAALEKLLGAP